MTKSKDTLLLLEAALSRILSGTPEKIDKDRKLSVRSVEIEAGLGNGSAYYYPDFVQKINTIKAQQLSNLDGNKPKTTNQKYKYEKQIKENYREQVNVLKKQLSQMATEHHQMTSVLICRDKTIKDLKDQIAKFRRESIGLVKPTNPTVDEKGESDE